MLLVCFQGNMKGGFNILETRLNNLIQLKVNELNYLIDVFIEDADEPYLQEFRCNIRSSISQIFRYIQDMIKCRDEM